MFKFLFAFLLLPTVVLAAPETPKENVWITPITAVEGETIDLHALVYNKTDKLAKVTIEFASPDEVIGSVDIPVQKGSAETALLSWTYPIFRTTVTASVISAVDTQKKNIPELLGVIGEVTIGTRDKTDATVDTVRGRAIGIFDTVDGWRKKQAQRYLYMRDSARQKLGIDKTIDLLDKVKYRKAVDPNNSSTIGGISISPAFPLGAYITLLFATAMATIFSSVYLFYTTVVLLFLLILRIIRKLF